MHSSEDDRSRDITSARSGALAPDFKESELLHLARAGNLPAFEVLYRRHASRVEMICRARLRHDADVADAVQETFSRAFRHFDSFDGGPRFGHWISRIARHAAIDIARKTRSRVEVPLEEAASAETVVDTASETVQRLAVRSMLRSLSVRDARLLVSHHIDGRSVRELATQWGLTEGAMAVALQRARVRARAAAVRQSLPAFICAVTWRVIGAVRSRTRQISVAAAVIPVVAAAVVVTPMLAPALRSPFPGDLESVQKSRPEVVQGSDAPGKRQADAVQSRRRIRLRTHNGEAGSTARRPRTSTEAPPGQSAVVPLESVAVPGTRGRVHSDRPRQNADYSFGARAGHGDSHTKVEIEAFDDPSAEPAHDVACDSLNASPDVVYCERDAAGF